MFQPTHSRTLLQVTQANAKQKLAREYHLPTAQTKQYQTDKQLENKGRTHNSVDGSASRNLPGVPPP